MWGYVRGLRMYISDVGIQVLRLAPDPDQDICVSSTAFGFTIALAAFLVLVVFSMGYCMLRRHRKIDCDKKV